MRILVAFIFISGLVLNLSPQALAHLGMSQGETGRNISGAVALVFEGQSEGGNLLLGEAVGSLAPAEDLLQITKKKDKKAKKAKRGRKNDDDDMDKKKKDKEAKKDEEEDEDKDKEKEKKGKKDKDEEDDGRDTDNEDEPEARKRGLDRADEAAGEHGRHGREKAREKQGRR